MGAFIAIMAAFVTMSIAVLTFRVMKGGERGGRRIGEGDGPYAPDFAAGSGGDDGGDCGTGDSGDGGGGDGGGGSDGGGGGGD